MKTASKVLKLNARKLDPAARRTERLKIATQILSGICASKQQYPLDALAKQGKEMSKTALKIANDLLDAELQLEDE